MTDEVQEKLDALKAKGDASAEEATQEREKSTNWNKGVKEGDMLAGVLTRGDKVFIKSRNEATYLLEIRDHETGDLFTVWCSAYMLNEAVVEKAPAEGSLVVVQFHGKQQLESGNSLNVFTVEVERTDFEYWTAIDLAYTRKRAAALAKESAKTAAPAFGPDEAPFAQAVIG